MHNRLSDSRDANPEGALQEAGESCLESLDGGVDGKADYTPAATPSEGDKGQITSLSGHIAEARRK